jgi:hypothetical protein
MERKTNLYIIFILVVGFLLQSCECPLQEPSAYSPCSVREVTITKFNPNGTLQDTTLPDGTRQTVFIPDSTYSIHTFLFPFDANSSGFLPNDERFKNTSSIILFQKPFSDGSPYFVAIFDNYPTNSELNGDLLLFDVADDFSNAYIRITGEIVPLPERFNSENSQQFCEFVNNLTRDTARINSLKGNLARFGLGLPIASVTQFTAGNVVVLDANGKVTNAVSPSSNDVQDLLKLTQNQAINLNVKIGDVFLYKARNGRFFIFAVTDLRQGSLVPYKKRLTIMFSAIS